MAYAPSASVASMANRVIIRRASARAQPKALRATSVIRFELDHNYHNLIILTNSVIKMATRVMQSIRRVTMTLKLTSSTVFA